MVTPDPLKLLALEESDAWMEYREGCRKARSGGEGRYDAVEPWLWSKLQQRLRAVAARRKKLRPTAA